MLSISETTHQIWTVGTSITDLKLFLIITKDMTMTKNNNMLIKQFSQFMIITIGKLKSHNGVNKETSSINQKEVLMTIMQ